MTIISSFSIDVTDQYSICFFVTPEVQEFQVHLLPFLIAPDPTARFYFLWPRIRVCG